MALSQHPERENDAARLDQSAEDTELAFMNALAAYRRARETGDPATIAAAESSLQQVVRDELSREME
jgi:hypothetical protein